MRLYHSLVSLWLLALALAQGSGQITNPLTSCSSSNTASGQGFFLQYNSYGACTTHCSGYAFAIMKGLYCWCSNYAPDDTVSVSECSDPCGGYKTDRCGNVDKGLYGYAQIGQASGTSSPSSDAASSSSSSSKVAVVSTLATVTQTSLMSTTATTSVTATVPVDSYQSSLTTEISSTVQASSTTSKTSSSSIEDPTTTEKPSISVTTVNASIIKTVTVVPTSSSSFNATASEPTGTPAHHKDTFWSDGGKVAGTFVGVGIGVVLIAGLLFFFLFKRRQKKRHDLAVLASPHGSSEHSGFHPKGSFYHRRQASGVSDADTNLVPIFDQRMEPTQMYMHWDQSESQISLADHEDYSRRVLRVANPDAENEKEPIP
ncbi:Cell wall integrity and stress response component 4 [Wickerhamiella sorbophila]|uniref:Cell wall integrity and stress response component 4 n=1 Tax=Wickerhamiella sorbophila TaxID=45607 RepID=A0A2T0FK41_9ASCO|nr:Cell wall integrity and stress response component 4 [Wickerhamiella sorbophila]PRT55363.1 Cell wall integrity and stress response component 4 [Wickerhamiella sorbophila]